MMNLREIQSAWNTLVPLAQARGIKAKTWAVPPQTIDRGMRRLNWLRSKLGIVAPQDQQVQHSPGAALPPIRDIVAQYNALIPEAQARGIRNARIWTGIPSTSLRGFQRLQTLRRKLGQSTAYTAPEQLVPLDSVSEFDELTWGLEIEAMLPMGYDRTLLAHDISSAGVPCRVEVYGHNVPDQWKIVTDASLRNANRGIELVTPVLNGKAGFEQLQKVCAVLAAKRIKVSIRCGLHIHVGWKTGLYWTATMLRNIVRTYNHFEDVIDSHMAPSRRGIEAGRGFCKSNKHFTKAFTLNDAKTITGVVQAVGQSPTSWRHASRYRKLNLQPLSKFGTIEFRHHHGTVDHGKITHWLKFCLRMVLAARAGMLPDFEAPATFANMAGVLLLPKSEADHFKGRIKFFEERERRATQRAA